MRASAAPGGSRRSTSPGHLKEIDINAKGVVNGLHAALPYLAITPNSVVVNLASASAIYGQAELANYSATKFFVRGITEALDIEWNRYGIRVIAMWPLYVQTAMTDNIKTGTTESLGIRLTAQDIADAIAKAVEPSWLRRAIHQVHFPVGSQTKVMAAGSRFSPALADPAGQQEAGALLSSPPGQPSATRWPRGGHRLLPAGCAARRAASRSRGLPAHRDRLALRRRHGFAVLASRGAMPSTSIR